MTELRTAIDGARTAMSFGAGAYTDSIGAGSPIRAVHENDPATWCGDASAWGAGVLTRAVFYRRPQDGAGSTPALRR